MSEPNTSIMQVIPSNPRIPEFNKLVNKEILLLTHRRQTLNGHNLHRVLCKVLILAQTFGYLPAQGITGPDSHSLHFSWKSLKVAYSIATISGALFVTIMQFNKMLATGTDLHETDRLLFNLSGVISGLLFLKLARNWPILMKDWSAVETSMVSYGWPPGLNRKLNTLLIVFMVIALFEHILTQSNKIVLALACTSDTGEAFNYFLSNMSFSNTFSVINYNVFTGLLLQAITLQLTFSWTFVDLFIMLLSTALACRFQQITGRLQALSDAKIGAEIIWKNTREDYNKLCKLCRRVDGEISYIVLMAFAFDLFFILTQLFNSLRPMRNNLERVYFYCSFGLLIVRTICLCLFGAKVNDESKKPIIVLNAVCSSVYNFEIQRLVQQIGTTEVAITGRGFFSITRSLILSVGAIVTYELVLIQFNDNMLKKSTTVAGSCPVFV